MTLKAALDRANPHSLPDHMRAVAIGSILRGQIPQNRFGVNPVADAAQLATLEQISLPDDARAWSLVRAYARAGGATLGELSVQAVNTTPATGQIAVAPNGDIVVLAADAWTAIDLVYVPVRGDVVSFDLPVATHVLTLPTSNLDVARGVLYLIDATATAGTSTGRKIILAPGAGAPAAGQARLNLAKGTVTFAVADAVTRATVKLLVAPEIDVHTLLEAAETTV